MSTSGAAGPARAYALTDPRRGPVWSGRIVSEVALSAGVAELEVVGALRAPVVPDRRPTALLDVRLEAGDLSGAAELADDEHDQGDRDQPREDRRQGYETGQRHGRDEQLDKEDHDSPLQGPERAISPGRKTDAITGFPLSVGRLLGGFLVVVVLAEHLKIGVAMVPAEGPSLYVVDRFTWG